MIFPLKSENLKSGLLGFIEKGQLKPIFLLFMPSLRASGSQCNCII